MEDERADIGKHASVVKRQTEKGYIEGKRIGENIIASIVERY